MTVKKKVFDILDKSEQNGMAEKIFDAFILVLIVLNVAAVITEPSITSPAVLKQFRTFEVFSIAVFTIEYLLRVWTADILYQDKSKMIAWLVFILSPMALIDLAAILPFYIPFLIPVDLRVLRMLRLFRLFRVLKINRYTNAMSTLLKVLKAKADQLISSLFVMCVLMIMTSVLMFNFENNAQPEVYKNVFDAMWWSVATLTTVGYGDIYPITAVGKFLAAIIAILGIGIAAIPTGIIASGFTEIIKDGKNSQKSVCPHCGMEIDTEN